MACRPRPPPHHSSDMEVAWFILSYPIRAARSAPESDKSRSMDSSTAIPLFSSMIESHGSIIMRAHRYYYYYRLITVELTWTERNAVRKAGLDGKWKFRLLSGSGRTCAGYLHTYSLLLMYAEPTTLLRSATSVSTRIPTRDSIGIDPKPLKYFLYYHTR